MNIAVDTSVREYPRAWRDVPSVLLVYFVFTVGVSVAFLSIVFFGSDKLRETMVPITGWIGGMPYMFSIFFVYMCCRYPSKEMRKALYVFLWFAVMIGALELLVQIPFLSFYVTREIVSSNPYLRVSPWCFVFSGILPVCWMLLLRLPQVTKWCREKAVPNHRIQPPP